MAEITRSLYGTIFQNLSSGQYDTAREALKTLLGYMTTYFPFRPTTVTNRDIKVSLIPPIWSTCLLTVLPGLKVEQSIQDLNLIYCELTSLLVLASYARPSNNPHARRETSRQTQTHLQASEEVLSIQAERVSEYVIQLLRGEASTSSPLGRPLTSSAYTALLPTIWSLLNRRSSGVLRAMLEHATKTSSKSAVKKSTIEFVARLVLVCPPPN